MEAMEEKETRVLIKPSEAARRLGRTARWVVNLARNGEIPAARVSNRWLIAWPDALEALLAKRGGRP
ncbi:MAG: helix-turn-helix domain-containing protein [Firmicutes bacterium]|nr:helix-turn-helix domain-containing protein [Alicyclobacillaceae bacterium]MCL6497032.1 helix-turn-helix domain-containing protein [Bacillota bacterium]